MIDSASIDPKGRSLLGKYRDHVAWLASKVLGIRMDGEVMKEGTISSLAKTTLRPRFDRAHHADPRVCHVRWSPVWPALARPDTRAEA